ncbi:hypothetical protein PUN28_020443 [Cardiocondyla obscurior]|uniref:Uncharacterized protein n=1 Tax=Cardiocondyla obscurior TaxID=286306 RepID=A0AAW2EA30_9HYME
MPTVLSPLEAEILTKNDKKYFENLATNLREVTRCPRNNFQRSTSTKSKDIDKKQKKNFFKSDHVTSCDIDEKRKKNF